MKEIEDIALRIKAARTELKISQRQMAIQMGMSSSYFSEIESGRKRPGAEFFLKSAHLFNINPNYLFLGNGKMFLPEQGKNGEGAFNFDREIETVDSLVWLMERSLFLRNSIMGYASKLILKNEDTIKLGMKKSKK